MKKEKNQKSQKNCGSKKCREKNTNQTTNEKDCH